METIYVNYEDNMNYLKDKLEQYVNKIPDYSDNNYYECIDYLKDKYECDDINDDLIYGDEEKQEKDLENNIKKDISKTDIKMPKSYSTKIEDITFDETSLTNNNNPENIDEININDAKDGNKNNLKNN
ncbi:hypothetical protein CU098_006032, partial [Rhizopus stolonifer]